MSIPIVTDADIARTAREAADIIDRQGWYQDDFYDHRQAAAGLDPRECRVCATGALRVAFGESPGDDDAEDASQLGYATVSAFADWLAITGRVEPPTDGEGPIAVIGSWNDDADRSADEVTAALRAFADDVERQATA